MWSLHSGCPNGSHAAGVMHAIPACHELCLWNRQMFHLHGLCSNTQYAGWWKVQESCTSCTADTVRKSCRTCGEAPLNHWSANACQAVTAKFSMLFDSPQPATVKLTITTYLLEAPRRSSVLSLMMPSCSAGSCQHRQTFLQTAHKKHSCPAADMSLPTQNCTPGLQCCLARQAVPGTAGQVRCRWC
jgi:hypothetical protein